MGYYSMDRGYGYGNPVESVAGGVHSEALFIDEDVIRFNPSGVDFCVVRRVIVYDEDEHQYYNRLAVLESRRTPHDQPYVDINIFPASAGHYERLSIDDTFRVSLDVYNPLSTEIHADLVLISAIFIESETYYHFYCPSESTLFSEVYCGIPVIIPGNLHIQNAAVYEVFLGVFPEESFDVEWTWWCALLDPVSLQPISNVCHDATALELQ